LQLAAREKWPSGWCFDGRKSIYAPGRFLPGGPQQDKTFPVEVIDPEADGKMETFLCHIRKVAIVSINHLRRWVENGRGDCPVEALQVRGRSDHETFTRRPVQSNAMETVAIVSQR
jgi:hypothetical protein